MKKTIIEQARNRKTNPLLNRIARSENQTISQLLSNIASGKTVIVNNRKRRIKNPCAIGKGLRTKVNVNIGTSTDKKSLSYELKKLDIAQQYKTDTIMDLSVSNNIRTIRKEIMDKATVPIGTVPIYEAAHRAIQKRKKIAKMTKGDLMEVLYEHANDGVDFFTIHAGITQRSVQTMRKKTRILPVVSRGGAILAHWIQQNKKENPLYEYFDEVIAIAKEFDITLSLGDALRPGSIVDATDKLQLDELKTLGELAQRALRNGVQIIIEGPGHVPLHQIERNIKLEKQLCNEAPFYVLGPLVTDIASGYDHISGAIGGALASFYGADFLC